MATWRSVTEKCVSLTPDRVHKQGMVGVVCVVGRVARRVRCVGRVRRVRAAAAPPAVRSEGASCRHLQEHTPFIYLIHDRLRTS